MNSDSEVSRSRTLRPEGRTFFERKETGGFDLAEGLAFLRGCRRNFLERLDYFDADIPPVASTSATAGGAFFAVTFACTAGSPTSSEGLLTRELNVLDIPEVKVTGSDAGVEAITVP